MFDGDGRRFAARLLDFAGDLFGFAILNIGDDDFGPFLGQSMSIGFADANAAAGDDRNFFFQTHKNPPLNFKEENFPQSAPKFG